MSCHAMPSCHAGTLGARPPSRGAARSTAIAPHLQNSEFHRAAAAPGRAERPLQHGNALVGTSVSFIAGHRRQQHSGTAAAALPVAAEPDTAVSDAGVSDSGAAGVTADEPVPSAEPSSVSVEPEAAAADAAAQAEQLVADAEAATGQAASSDAAAAASPSASEGDTTEATRAAAAAVREAAARPKPSAQGRKQHPKQKHKVVQRKPPQRRQQEQEQNVHEPAGPVEPVPQEDRWFRAGDVVPCKVEWSNARGARVSTLRDPRIIGYMPAKEGPYHLRTEDELHDTPPHQKQDGWAAPILPPGLVREFQVLKVPQDMEYNGRGPLLSARLVDLDTLWARAEQALRACRRGKETVRVRFLELNEGGLMARFLGLRLFMPLSHLAREEPGKFVPAEELEQKYLQGTLTEVAITEVDAFNRRFVCSENLGLENAAIRRLQTGSLVWGTVRRVEDFGAFVGFDDTRASGLIHISNISRQHVEYTEEVFKLGDRVRAVVLSAEDDYTRFSLSTAELEERPGDMLRDREKVYENAEEQVKIFLELQAEAAAEDAAYGATDEPRDSEILASGHY